MKFLEIYILIYFIYTWIMFNTIQVIVSKTRTPFLENLIDSKTV